MASSPHLMEYFLIMGYDESYIQEVMVRHQPGYRVHGQPEYYDGYNGGDDCQRQQRYECLRQSLLFISGSSNLADAHCGDAHHGDEYEVVNEVVDEIDNADVRKA